MPLLHSCKSKSQKINKMEEPEAPQSKLPSASVDPFSLSIYSLSPEKNDRSNLRVGSITSRCSGTGVRAPPRTHGWTLESAIVNFHQSGGRLLKLSRQRRPHKLFCQSRFSNWRMRRSYFVWRAIVFWSALKSRKGKIHTARR